MGKPKLKLTKWTIIEDDVPMMPNGGRISLEEFRPKFSNSNQNIQQEIIDKQKFENSKVVQQQKTLETIKNLQEKYRERYEPSQSVKNSKSFLSAGQLAQPLNLPLKAIATGADLETSLRYALDGQYNKSIEDLVQAGVNWIPFLKQEKMLNLSKGLPSLAYRFNEAIPKINQATDYIQKGNDIKTITEVKKNGGRIPKAGDGKNMGYSWSTNTAQAPKQQVVGSVENTQTSKPSIQPFQKGYVNPNIMTSKTGEEGLGDDLGGMMVTAALAPGSLPFKASSRLGRIALGAGELANPISGFRGIKSMSSSLDGVNNLENLFRKKPLSKKQEEMYKWFEQEERFNSLPKTINKESLNVLEDFKTRIKTPEGQKRMQNLGIYDDAMLQKLEVIEDPNTFGYYTGDKNKIVMNPDHPLPRKVVRHEIEHGVQNALSINKMNKLNNDIGNFKYLFRPKKAAEAEYETLKPTSKIDDILSGLELRREGTPNKTWDTSKITSDEPVDISRYKSLISNKQNATDYFLTGSNGKEKSAFLAEVQQYMMDAGTIPKRGYTEITPEMVKNTMADSMFDEEQGGKFLRLFNIMKASDNNYDLVAKGLNKMLGVVPPTAIIGAGAATQIEQKKSGGKIKLKPKSSDWEIIN